MTQLNSQLETSIKKLVSLLQTIHQAKYPGQPVPNFDTLLSDHHSALESQVKKRVYAEYQASLSKLEAQAKESIEQREKKIIQLRTEKKALAQELKDITVLRDKNEVLQKEFESVREISKRGE